MTVEETVRGNLFQSTAIALNTAIEELEMDSLSMDYMLDKDFKKLQPELLESFEGHADRFISRIESTYKVKNTIEFV
jgi:hypothetical protein